MVNSALMASSLLDGKGAKGTKVSGPTRLIPGGGGARYMPAVLPAFLEVMKESQVRFFHWIQYPDS